ncbi:hypothetical protein BST61_g5995 [Cercospora zeina]
MYLALTPQPHLPLPASRRKHLHTPSHTENLCGTRHQPSSQEAVYLHGATQRMSHTRHDMMPPTRSSSSSRSSSSNNQNSSDEQYRTYKQKQARKYNKKKPKAKKKQEDSWVPSLSTQDKEVIT